MTEGGIHRGCCLCSFFNVFFCEEVKIKVWQILVRIAPSPSTQYASFCWLVPSFCSSMCCLVEFVLVALSAPFAL